MVNLINGNKLGQTSHAQMAYAIPSDPLMFDVNGDGIFDRGYVGDLGGNLWRISDSFGVTRLFDGPNDLRMFYPPDAVLNSGSVTVYFGTGDRTNPMEDDDQNRFYAVQDDGTNDVSEGGLGQHLQPDRPTRQRRGSKT
jgi:type IV pilus assembly protein PilY1